MFEEYLKEVHAKTYTGTDDNMQEDFECWLANLDEIDLMELANDAFGKIIKQYEKKT